ncbi:hypothetical protein PAXRUDRAFT_824978 [Paxillus rubicundulus Ve08.2h10]|uniref:P-loop containing nucleoside triphosphate hydrolase protein n=1 Tax=Paxillus rubicundulus Ve08.2h10 TaxID=930991 RepID=A0A0D0E739_9AGAM|nr:hypothetical protein PAXRUDRAFT_824978 [Paxillus rubicundulus Ve08.2h10]
MNNHEPSIGRDAEPSIRTSLRDSDSSLSSIDIKQRDSQFTLPSPTTSTHDIPPAPAPAPTIKLLFSFLTPRRKLVLLAPAVASSVAAGGLAPFMTYVIGQSFNAFAAFPLTPDPPQSAKDALLRGVGLAALELVALGIGALLMSSVTSSLWIWTGEYNVVELRKMVYKAIVHKEMEWFDRQMGSEDPANVQDASGEGAPIGAGGLMAKFARETDEVRAASSLAAGQLIQYLTTTLAALVLAFSWSPLLTLIILSALPFLILIQGFSQVFASPRLAQERTLTARAATLVSRVVSNIGAVKAANAASYEHSLLARVAVAVKSLAAIWGVTAGTSQFVTMAMFVQGFWFGAHLVRQGKNQPGDVMSVFWACLIATSNLQMAVPLMVVLAKGKTAAAELAGIISNNTSPVRTTKRRKVQALRRITPRTFVGDFSLTNLTFSYPTRPTVPVLRNVDMYLPSRETTFIVGPSGCGKSTLGSVLLGYYTPELGRGEVLLDEQDVRYLDSAWLRRHVAGVTQGSAGVGAQVFRGSIHWNVALGAAGSGRRAEDVTRAEVEEACRVAMLEGWVLGLEAAYETVLAGSGDNGKEEGGVTLSGGMRQRLALARARIRDPEVLILDESTSALDPPTRLLTTAAIRAWRTRAQKTTIIITHDLTSVNADDFVYVMREGCVVEQGFRGDLEKAGGEWGRMVCDGGCSDNDDEDRATESDEQPPIYEEVADILASREEEARETQQRHDRHFSVAPTLGGVRPVTMALGGWMFDVVAELTKTANGHSCDELPALPTVAPPIIDKAVEFEGGAAGRPRRPSSMSILIPSPTFPARAYDGRRLSLQFTPVTPSFSSPFASATSTQPMVEDDEEFDMEKANLQRSAEQATGRRERRARKAHDIVQVVPASKTSKSTSKGKTIEMPDAAEFYPPTPGLITTLRLIYPTIPAKPLLFLGLFACLLSGAMTPIFSFLLSRLMFEVSANPADASIINSYGGLVLGIAAIDGLLLGSKYFLMETSAIRWVTRLRNNAYFRVLSQDKSWFDSSSHSPATITQVLVKDADDARTLVAVVIGQCVVVIAMMGLGLLWAMVWGWQLTLVGVAIGPVFVAVMGIQAGLVAKCEVRNKRAREEVARVYYESILNVRSIRAMSLEAVLQSQFDKAASLCLSTGIRGAFVEGCSYGVASALIYLAEALLFYVGAVLIARGTYTYLQMVQVLNLVVFTVTIGSQLMAFTQKIAKTVQATTDLFQLVNLRTDGTNESQGIMRPPIEGDLVLKNVCFTYPTNPDTPVLTNLSMRVAQGECVALVGASGCGKSTVAALLQRLYEPTSGKISVGLNDLRSTDVHHLREHVAIVNQTPNLFDGSIRENIAYGRVGVMEEEDVARAARAANVHDFILSLPQGYDTPIGENAALISGGQAQRLQIARALARPSKILILDECTSALDGANQSVVMETIKGAKVGRTTVMITHKVPVMKMCDRILVIDGGEVVEQGTYEELLERKGFFAKLASGGEWVRD